MPHLRLEVAEEWLREDFKATTGFDAKKLLDHLVKVVAGLRMDNPDPDIPEQVPFINLVNLKHAIVPLHYAHVAGDPARRFLHITMSAGNETKGRTAEVRRRVAETLGNEVDAFVAACRLDGLASVTVQVKDIDRDRGYTTTAERKKKRDQKS
jgi:5-carboxymethyl-2-hydroxymuconate isomerase